MQNSAHFGKNGVSNLKKLGVFCLIFWCAFTEERANLVRTSREKREKNTNVFGKDTSLFLIFFIIFDYTRSSDNFISMTIWKTMMTCLLTIQKLFHKVQTQTTGTNMLTENV